MSNIDGNLDSRWPHRIACLLACVVFPLIWVGNLVTTADAGMAVPDWPNTYGYNLFAYPYREWFLGPWDLFVEHGHRLLASLAGLISIVLLIVTWRFEKREWVQFFALGLFALVVVQGLLGGIRVLGDARWVAKVHGCVGPGFFAATVAFCVVTSRWWEQVQPLRPDSTTGVLMRLVPRFATAMLVVSFGQLVLGAFLRHIEDTASPSQYALLVTLHVITAVILVAGTVLQFGLTRRAVLRGQRVKASINVLALLVLVQFGLGIGTWAVKFGWPVWFEQYAWAASFVIPEKSFLQINLVTAHAAVGSLILACWTVHSLRTNRIFRREQAHLTSVNRSGVDAGLSQAWPNP